MRKIGSLFAGLKGFGEKGRVKGAEVPHGVGCGAHQGSPSTRQLRVVGLSPLHQ